MARHHTKSGRYVVVGGAGFLGRELLRQLRQAGVDDLRVVDLAGTERDLPVGVRFFPGDIRGSDLDPAFEGARTVLHVAACQYHSPLAPSTYDLPFHDVNVGGTERVVAAARRAGAERLVFVSTNMVYGLPQRLPVDESHPLAPFGPYGQSKLAAERIVLGAADGALRTSVVRPGLIVGPGRVGVIARVFDMILAGRPVPLVGDGSNRYEMMAVEDVASLTLAAVDAPAPEAFNCVARELTTMRTWIETLARSVGSRTRTIGVPGWAAKPVFRALESIRRSPLRRDQYLIADRDYYLDGARAERVLGWRPKWGSLEAIEDNFRWYLERRGG